MDKITSDSIIENVRLMNRLAEAKAILHTCESVLGASDQDQEHPVVQELLQRIAQWEKEGSGQ